jgi:PPM family protein phosphatase
MIPIDHPQRRIFSDTSTGLVRPQNEDRFAIGFFQMKEKDTAPILLAVVADGVGGQKAGEKAASIAVELIPEYLASFESDDVLKGLESAILAANAEIVRLAETNPDYSGMASTCAAAVVVGNRLFIANVGDSRIYVLRNEKLFQISRDHTLESEIRFFGLANPQMVSPSHRRSHVITRYLGSSVPPKVDLGYYLNDQESTLVAANHQGMELAEHDLVLVCSDGLTDMLSDEEIETVMKSNAADQLVEKLTDAALQKGGEDNITLVVIDGPIAG